MNQEQIDAMRTGPFQNHSYFGYKSNVLKSGICKYFRRGIFDKFEWCVIEMLIFGFKSKALVTNVMNRLRILIMEEIACNDYSIICKAISLCNETDKIIDIKDKMKHALRLCNVLKQAKRGRIVSYVNTWWRNHPIEIKTNDIVLDKVIQYKKKNDSDELLQLGELLIHAKDETMIISIYNRMIQMKGTFGCRFRRRDAVYLFWEIMKERLQNDSIFEFAFHMFIKKCKESPYYGIWISLLVIYDMNKREIRIDDDIDIDIDEYLKNRVKIKMDEYVVNDWHVNKAFGMDVFAKNGAVVVDEDISILGIEKGTLYKNYYIESKINMSHDKNKKKNIDKDVEYIDKDVEYIDFDAFEIIKVFDEGVCGMKKCCILVLYKNKKYVLKEMGKGLHYGIDYKCIDDMKDMFGIQKLNIKRIKSNKTMVRKNKLIKSYGKGNWDFENAIHVYYCLMDYFEHIGDVGKNKQILKDNMKLQHDLIKIRLFDGLFRSSDNNMRNILVTNDHEFISIDEGDLFGKRTHIFNKNDYCIKYIDKTVFEQVCDFIMKQNIDDIVRILKYYGFHDKVNECKERFVHFKKIVMEEKK